MTVLLDNSKDTDRSTSGLAALVGKYLTFKIGHEMYGLEISKIQEVIKIMDITRIPKMPESIRGVINLRGKVIPVVELRTKFNLGVETECDRACIVVVQITRNDRQVAMGIIIDEILEVRNIEENQLEEAPSFGTDINTDFIFGIGKLGKNVVILLDIENVLSQGELNIINQVK